MKRLLTFLLCCCLSATTALLALDDERTRPINQLLEELDVAIANKNLYQAKRQHIADSLLRAAQQAQGQERINLLRRLHHNYENYHAD